MSAKRRSTSPTSNSTGASRRARPFLRVLVTIVVLAILPFSAGCLPEMMVPALVAIPVLHDYLTKDGPAVRPRPAPAHRPSTPVQPPVSPPQINTSTLRANSEAIERALPQPQASVQSIPREAVTGSRSTTRQAPRDPAPLPVVRPTPPMEFFPIQRMEPTPGRPPTAASAIKEGAQAYREMRWDDATRTLNRALGSGACTNPEQNQAHILLGAIEYQQGNPEAAKAHFTAAYRYDRDTSPSSQLFPPQLIDFYRTVNGIKRP